MDTATQIPAKFIENIELIQPADISDDELNIIKNYIELTRDVQETKQLFDVFYFNLLSLRNDFTLYAGDTVEKLPNCPESSSETIAVNALVINLISSAKTLVEALRTTAIRWLEKDEGKKDEFNIYVSGIYDKSSVYRILMNLRDYAQHGSLPVSQKEGKYSFDFSQILNTPHFRINGQVKTDMEEFLSTFDSSEVIACLALTITIADFVVKVVDIYRNFLFYIKGNVSSSYAEIKKIITLKPNIICDAHRYFKGFIIFLDEDTYHAFDPNDNPNKMITEYDKYTAEIFKDEKNAFDKLYSKSISLSKKELSE